jgi:hypothetical protein
MYGKFPHARAVTRFYNLISVLLTSGVNSKVYDAS